MSDLWVLVILVAGVIALTPIADPLRIPQPVLLTIFGVLAGVMPFASPLHLEPELILPVVLPPLLFAATQRTTSTEFRAQAAPVLALAVGLTISTAAAVAVVAHAAGLAWGPAWLIGAIVSPPDPVAATAVARRLRLPHRIVTILEGEGMFNDATALVLYKVALAAVVTGEFSYLDTGLEFAVTVVVGVLVGFVIGWVAKRLLQVIHEPYTETTITVVAPFVAYLGAERVEGSGVLAVLVLGLYLRNVGHEATTSRGWLLGRSVWDYADFLITSLAFAVLGFELATVLAEEPGSSQITRVTIGVLLTVVLFRFAWLFPAVWLVRARRRRHDGLVPVGWQETTVVAWSGMRGVVTVATALALPLVVDSGSTFPDRHLLVVAALVCVLVTLVVQGLTLAPLTSRLGVASEHDEVAEVTDLRARAAGAALDFLRETPATGEVSDDVRDAARLRYESYLDVQSALARTRGLDRDDADPAAELDQLLAQATDVERTLVLDERRPGHVTAGSADQVLREIESRAMRDLG